MTKPLLYGADYSCYVRIARLALFEKGVDYELVPVDVFASDGLPEWYKALHPFGRIPAFDHGGFRLFETTAITRYIDEGFGGPRLQPSDPKLRARMNQIIGLLDAYAYRTMVWDIYVETVEKPEHDGTVDEARVTAALSLARTALQTLAGLKAGGPFLLGDALSLADLHAVPIFAFFAMAPLGSPMIERHAELSAWWQSLQERPSFEATRPTAAS